MTEEILNPEDQIDDDPIVQKYAARFNQLALLFVNYADKNNCIIAPRGVDTYIESFMELGTCSCDEKRKSCPCKQAKEEIENIGHCECLLFWKDYKTYYDWFKQRVD